MPGPGADDVQGAPGAGEQLAFDVVPDSKADFEAGFLGAGTPLARAILDRPAGSRIPYRMADIVEVRILSVTPAASVPSGDTAASRQAVIDEAVEVEPRRYAAAGPHRGRKMGRL